MSPSSRRKPLRRYGRAQRTKKDLPASGLSVANIRKRRRRGIIATAMVCPGGGADRLIPLSFPVYRREAGDQMHPEVRMVRPMAKCCDCGKRLYAKDCRGIEAAA